MGTKSTADCIERMKSSPSNPYHRGLVPVLCEDLQAHFNSGMELDEE